MGLSVVDVTDVIESNSDRRPTNSKRKADEAIDQNHKRARKDSNIKTDFRKDLFDTEILDGYTNAYATAKPYKHGVIRDLMNADLLRAVRDEARSHLSFTPKETDIYKIHQSGDLANLDGLDKSSLDRLPSLCVLRDALYSPEFRAYLSTITNSGPLSGTKTDMAINVYTPGCHLLCHDDVIGSRRVSYILYLTDPGKPWKAEWGGALRLYPTETVTTADGQEFKSPSPEFSLSIPPSFNQLSFFAVQPGESFHDVEEVYARKPGERGDDVDGGRVRMAISGWYHIPQEGEEGYVEGLEEKLAEKSSLTQLEGKSDQLDFPQLKSQPHDTSTGDDADLSEKDLDFLLRFMAPTYLTPDTLDQLQSLFADESCLRLETFLSPKFEGRLRSQIEAQEKSSSSEESSPDESWSGWNVARPPHKHRFLYKQHEGPADSPKLTEGSALDELLHELLPSSPFRKWLSLATDLQIESSNLLTRRFRKGSDYSLAVGYDEPKPRLEVSLGITPTQGWEEDDEEADQSGNHTGQAEAPGVGGYEVYMAGENADSENGSDNGEDGTQNGKTKKQSSKVDPAVYQASGTGEEDDGVLFSMPASWNRVSIVLRDKGVLRFVKYVSQAAQGDRWDVLGEFGIVDEDEGEENEGE
ncbi:MAG: hypothetical protein M1833_003005 [Piccolia ochrophora]|nr:MAG: hypothetical protein M1833_003005 [Piccolia ochrophora]